MIVNKPYKEGRRIITSENKSLLYHLYCDESRQSKDRFMVLGGIILLAEDVEKFNKTMRGFRLEQKMFAELKWSKVSQGKMSEYKRFVDYFFALNNTDKLHFHCILIDNHQVNHKKFSGGDHELGFYKFYYQLLLHSFGKNYTRENEKNRFLVFLDQRTSSYSLNELKTTLNNGMFSKFDIATNPFRSVEPRDSKETELIQISDIIIGAIGYQKNGHHLIDGASPAKCELAAYIAEQAGLSSLTNDTLWSNSRFTIWNLKLQK